jgi:hypothetical protein
VELLQSYVMLYEQAIRRSDFSIMSLSHDSIVVMRRRLSRLSYNNTTCQEARRERHRGYHKIERRALNFTLSIQDFTSPFEVFCSVRVGSENVGTVLYRFIVHRPVP